MTGPACSSSTVSAASASRPSLEAFSAERPRGWRRSSSGSTAVPSSRRHAALLPRSPPRPALVRSGDASAVARLAHAGSPAVIVRRPLRGPAAARCLAAAVRSSRRCPPTPACFSRVASPRWPTGGSGSATGSRSLALGNLGRAAAFEGLLRRDGIEDEISSASSGSREDIRCRCGWRPRHLWARVSAGDREAAPMSAIVDELTELYLSGLDPVDPPGRSTRLRSCAGRPCRCSAAMLPDAEPQEVSTDFGAFHSWSSGRTASWSTTPSVKAWRPTFGPPIPIAGDDIGSLPGGSSARRCRARLPQEMWRSPRTCSTCSRIPLIRGSVLPDQ